MYQRYRRIFEARAHGEEAGFTLIELLIVIVVLGVLAAVVIFGLSGLTGQSAVSACNADAKTTEIAVEAYHAQQGNWPPAGAAGATALTTLTGNPPVRYLRTFPNNPNHYTITLAANGVVDVTPLNGSGGSVSVAGPMVIGPTDYDNATMLGVIVGGSTNSANPCAYVS
jgi:general secretion pathway protein G